jgi:metal-responsive CopG/Arc/MetJ family transcriptional regulator
MESISLKLDENMLTNIDTTIRTNNYSTRTEFIRDAIREKLEDLKREQFIEEFMKFKGKAKKKTTYAENRKTREIALKELIKERGWDI